MASTKENTFERKIIDGKKNPKYIDLLEEDKSIAGQKFVCVSFVSPENIIKNKHLYLIIPILAMICDWSENYLEILMLESYLQSNLIPENLVSLGSGINSFKWILSSLTYLVILLGILFVFKNLFKKNKKNLA